MLELVNWSWRWWCRPHNGCVTCSFRLWRAPAVCCQQKKQLIQEELNGRIVKLHEMQKRDFLIPLAAGPTGLGVGVGMEHVFMGATNVVTDGLCSPSGSSAIQQVAAHPAEALHSALAGATEQTLEMTFGIENLGLGVIPGSDLSSELLAANTTWITLPNGAEAAGFQQACCYLKDQKKPRPSLLSLGVHRKRWRYSTAEARQPTLCYAAGSSV